MVQNLNHYEKILSRSHSNYLAQISIEMAKANNDTNDTLSRLTVLGTILVPMNLVTGLWVFPSFARRLTTGDECSRSWTSGRSSDFDLVLLEYISLSSMLTVVLFGLACFAFISVIVLRRTGLV